MYSYVLLGNGLYVIIGGEYKTPFDFGSNCLLPLASNTNMPFVAFLDSSSLECIAAITSANVVSGTILATSFSNNELTIQGLYKQSLELVLHERSIKLATENSNYTYTFFVTRIKMSQNLTIESHVWTSQIYTTFITIPNMVAELKEDKYSVLCAINLLGFTIKPENYTIVINEKEYKILQKTAILYKISQSGRFLWYSLYAIEAGGLSLTVEPDSGYIYYANGFSRNQQFNNQCEPLRNTFKGFAILRLEPTTGTCEYISEQENYITQLALGENYNVYATIASNYKATIFSPLKCIPCPIGFYSSFNGSNSCSMCPANSYNSLVGQTSCQGCSLIALHVLAWVPALASSSPVLCHVVNAVIISFTVIFATALVFVPCCILSYQCCCIKRTPASNETDELFKMFEIDWNNIEFNELNEFGDPVCIAKGAFGAVYKAIYMEKKIAVKVFEREEMINNIKREFVKCQSYVF